MNQVVRSYLDHKFSDQPIIIGGPPRSGTTLLLSILGSHKHIYSIDYETTAFHPEFHPEKLLSALLFENENWHFRKISSLKTRFAEKTPGNIRHTREINEFFDGKVKIINIFRDARDVITSRHPLNPDQYWVSLDRWINDVKSGLEAQCYNNVYSVKYEDLVASTESTVTEICNFIGEAFDSKITEFQKHTTVQNHLAWQTKAKAVYTDSIKKWERPEHNEKLKEFMSSDEAKELSQKLGYVIQS